MNRWLQSFPYFFREALLDMRENRAVAALTIVTTTISLIFFGVLWIVQVNVSDLIGDWRERFQVEVFLKNEISSAEKEAIRSAVLRYEAVERVAERTSDDALRKFREQLGSNAGVLDGLGEAFLPSSYLVILRPGWRTMVNIESLMAQVRVMPGVERLRNDLAWLRRLEGAIHLIRLAVWTISALLGLGVLFIIANTIRLTLFARRDDIAIMHLVGATDGFIRTPYVTEGVLCGALGGAMAYAVLLMVYYAFFLPMLSGFSGVDISIQPGGWPLGFILLGTGAGLGFLGSSLTVGHYLRKQRE